MEGYSLIAHYGSTADCRPIQPGAPRRPVPEELDQLAKETETIGDLVGELRERLGPVLANHPVAGEAMGKDLTSAHCPLHATLAGLRDTLQRHGVALKEILDALEV